MVREVGSGVNGRRPELRRVLSDPSGMVIVVEQHDRLARSGWGMWIRCWPAWRARNRVMRVVAAAENTDVDMAA